MLTNLSDAACYDAVTRDDPEFDGLFFSAVVTTGIYCRPVCRSRTPRPENVRFFATAAAASEAGFRPCLRCHPESAPDVPEWRGGSPLVWRALRLIAAGELDEHGTDELARRLHVSPRQLRRHFIEALGAPPIAIAQTRRLLFAKKLIDETDLSFADVAFSAGYSSVRRFNDAIQQTYGRSPSELRRSRRHAATDPAIAFAQLKLAYRRPYDWPAVLTFLRARAVAGVEVVDARAYRRTIQVDGVAGSIELMPVPPDGAVLLRVPSELARQLLSISERIKRLFDLRADPAAIDGWLEASGDLGTVVRRHQGLRVPGAWDGYEATVRAVLGEDRGDDQFKAIAARLVTTHGKPYESEGAPGLSHLFPDAERLASAKLTTIGVSEQQEGCIHTIARAVLDGSLSFDGVADLADALTRLMQIPGMKKPTAHYIAMRAMSEPDAYPGDLAATNADTNLVTHSAPPGSVHDPSHWQPWRAYAAMYLWADASQIGFDETDRATSSEG